MRIRTLVPALMLPVLLLCGIPAMAQDSPGAPADNTVQNTTPPSEAPPAESTIKKDLSTDAHGGEKKSRMPSTIAPSGMDKALPGEEIPGTGLEGNY